jgi:hypothetical protein
VAPITAVFDSIGLEVVMQDFFTDDSANTLQTRAVTILKKGNLVYERTEQDMIKIPGLLAGQWPRASPMLW